MMEYPIWYIGYNISLVVIAAGLTYALSALLKRKHRDYWWGLLTALLGFLWLIFFPNTVYLIAEFRHIIGFCTGGLNHICREEAWVLPIFFLYSWVGYFSFVALLHLLQKSLAKAGFRETAHWFPIVLIPMAALGMLIGLVDRWNSVDLFLAPEAILRDAVSYFTTFQGLWLLFIYSAMMYLLYYGTVIALKKIHTKI